MRRSALAIAALLALSGCGGEEGTSIGQAGRQNDAVRLVDQMGWKDSEGDLVLVFTDFAIPPEARARAVDEKSPMPLVEKGRVLVASVRMRRGLDPANAIGSRSVERTGLTFWNFSDAPVVIEKDETAEEAETMFPGFEAALTDKGWASGMMRGTQIVERRGEKSVFLWNVGFQVSF